VTRFVRVTGGLRGLPFWGIHVGAVVGVVVLGWSWTGLALAIALHYARMFFLSGAFHRYFAHRAYRVSRPVQFLLALGGTTCVQRGPLWWAANHRHHHKYSDQPEDLHSPRNGFWWSHAGWFLCGKYERVQTERIRDFARYPELRWLDRYYWAPVVACAAVTFLAGGWWGFVWGSLVSTVILWHATFTINSLAHVIGSRRYATTDDSKNHVVLALLTMGEGWHNNHHHYQRSVNQGFFWWEIDLSYYVLRALAAVGIVRDLHRAPAHVVASIAHPARTERAPSPASVSTSPV
jgi:stearoyl-CoA desaturase (Delta-9 desaturase)